MKEQIPGSLTLDKLLLNEKYIVNYYQREYRWGRKQIDQLIKDLYDAFTDSINTFSDNNKKDINCVDKMDFYYMGTIIVTKEKDGKTSIIDGQQRLTSLSLLLIALSNLNKQFPGDIVEFEDSSNLIFNKRLNTRSFNINVPEWNDCFNALISGKDFNDSNSGESVKNIVHRYNDILDILTETLQDDDNANTIDGDLLAMFNSWIRYKVIFIKIETPSEQDAHKVFVSMNDRGLSLNPSEMLKGYLLSEINDDSQRNEANEIWKSTVLKLKESESAEFNGEFNTEDMNFLSCWLRAQYANTMRQSKKDSQDMDYEIIGREFHEWIRQNHKQVGLNKSSDYYDFIKNKFSFFAKQYLRLKQLSKEYTSGYEAVFYNADKQANYQMWVILATLDEHDSEEITNTKIKLVSTYIDQYTARRIFNFSKFNWNSIKYEMFYIMKSIRGLSLDKLTVYLTQKLNDMSSKISGIIDSSFCWNQFTGRYILHVLARFTDYVDVLMGDSSNFPSYINRNVKNSYDREHVIPDKYEDYRDKFSSLDEFNTYRQKIGNLVLLKLDKNRSYQNMTYSDKKEYYYSDNVLARSFNEKSYSNNPKFLNNVVSKYPFKAYSEFGKQGIDERQRLYYLLAEDIYKVDHLRKISGSWDEEYNQLLINNKLQDSFNLDILNGNVESSTFKKPLFIEIDGYKIRCDSFTDMVVKTVDYLLNLNHEAIMSLAKQNFYNRIKYLDNDDKKEELLNSMMTPKDTIDSRIFVDVHASAKDLVMFVKQLLLQLRINNAFLYLK